MRDCYHEQYYRCIHHDVLLHEPRHHPSSHDSPRDSHGDLVHRLRIYIRMQDVFGDDSDRFRDNIRVHLSGVHRDSGDDIRHCLYPTRYHCSLHDHGDNDSLGKTGSTLASVL